MLIASGPFVFLCCFQKSRNCRNDNRELDKFVTLQCFKVFLFFFCMKFKPYQLVKLPQKLMVYMCGLFLQLGRLNFYTPVGIVTRARVRQPMNLGSISGRVTGFTSSHEIPDETYSTSSLPFNVYRGLCL